MRLLAVDDDPTFLEVLKNFIKWEADHELQTATSAEDALRMIEVNSEPYDAFLLDILMPGMNGVELCAAIRNIESCAHVPIIMLTVVSQRHMIDDAFAAGATDYIVKPLDPLELKSRIEKVERFRAERQRITTIPKQSAPSESLAPGMVDFEAPVSLDGFDKIVEYVALENYLMTLDRRGLIAHAAFGVHFENASQIYIRANSVEYFKALTDTATALSNAMLGKQYMFTYAGAGDFIVVTLSQGYINLEELEAAMNKSLSRLTSVYAVNDLPTPRLRVGNQVRNGLFRERRANEILQQAIRKAHISGHPEMSEDKHLSLLREAMKN